jgi:fatty-acyl-CoA synthase
MTADAVLPAGSRRESVTDAVVRAARRHPDRVAIVHGAVSWSYGELIATAEALARGMAQQGVGKGTRVACLGRNSDRYVLVWLACHMIGAIHVPINYMLGPGEVSYLLNSSGAQMLFSDLELAETADAAAKGSEIACRAILAGDATPAGYVDFEELLLVDGEEPVCDVVASDIAQIAYTSGTESTPKGAMLSHAALMSQYQSCMVAGCYAADDTVVHALPLYHSAQLHCFLMPHLALGARNVLLRDASPGPMIEALAAHRADSVFAPPTVWIALLRHEQFAPERLGSLRKGYYGASIMPVEIIRELQARLPQLKLWNFYGQTELCPLATCLQPEDQVTRAGSAGVAVLNVETRVVDDAMRPVGPGEVGEVVHRSPQLFSGYFNDPVRTASAFSDGWFRSGDLATVDGDGYLTIVDRKKDMINSGGENVASREVEEALYEHAAVAEVAVIALPDPKWIEAVCAVVVARDGASVSADELIGFARSRLAGFKVPKTVVFVDQLPKNASGKILKRELRDSLDQPDSKRDGALP